MIDLLKILGFVDLEDGFLGCFGVVGFDHVHRAMRDDQVVENGLDYGQEAIEYQQNSRRGGVANCHEKYLHQIGQHAPKGLGQPEHRHHSRP